MNEYQFIFLLYGLFIVVVIVIPEIHREMNKERREAGNNLKTFPDETATEEIDYKSGVIDALNQKRPTSSSTAYLDGYSDGQKRLK